MDSIVKEKEILIDIESNEGSHGAHVERGTSSADKKGKASLKKLVSGILHYHGSNDDDSGEYQHETTKLLTDRNTGGQRNEPHVDKGTENERQKDEKAKMAAKPPRPPKGPTLDAADMRLLKEITKIAKKKQERMKRIKAIKKMKVEKVVSTSPSSSSSLASPCATISAMFITGVFFLVIILQGLGSSSSSHVKLVGAQPVVETMGLTPIEFYKTVMSDDGATPSLLPPKSTGKLPFRVNHDT